MAHVNSAQLSECTCVDCIEIPVPVQLNCVTFNVD